MRRAALLFLITASSLLRAEAPAECDSKNSDFSLVGDEIEPTIESCSKTAKEIVKIANLISLDGLIGKAQLNPRSARHILLFRAGPDGVEGTPDDVKISSLEELDSISYVGPSTFAKLLKAHRQQLFTELPMMDAFCSESCTDSAFTDKDAIHKIHLPNTVAVIGKFSMAYRERIRYHRGITLPWSPPTNSPECRAQTEDGRGPAWAKPAFLTIGEISLTLQDNKFFIQLRSSDLSFADSWRTTLKLRFNVTTQKMEKTWFLDGNPKNALVPFVGLGKVAPLDRYDLRKLHPEYIFFGRSCVRIPYSYSEDLTDSSGNNYSIDRQVVVYGRID